MLIKLNKIILISPKLYSYDGEFSKQKWWKMPLSLKEMNLDSGKTFSSSFSNHPVFGITPLDFYFKVSEQQFFTGYSNLCRGFYCLLHGLEVEERSDSSNHNWNQTRKWMDVSCYCILLCFCFLDFLINWLIFLAKMFKQNKNSREGRVVWVNELKSDE